MIRNENYVFQTEDEEKFRKEIEDMELSDNWLNDIPTTEMHFYGLDQDKDGEYGIFLAAKNSPYSDYDAVQDTAVHGKKLMLSADGFDAPLSGVSTSTLHQICGIGGDAFSSMEPREYADALNLALNARRRQEDKHRTMLLIRGGKVCAFHSDNRGGYQVMRISQLLNIARDALSDRFGIPRFRCGTNRVDESSCIWDLPDASVELASAYASALSRSEAAKAKDIIIMPCAAFKSSDTSNNTATLNPVFRTQSGAKIQLVDGVKVKHQRTLRESGNTGSLREFESRCNSLFARFEDVGAVMNQMADTTIYHPQNAFIGICNKLRIPKKYGSDALQDLNQIVGDKAACSALDIYICLIDIPVSAEKEKKISSKRLNDLEEKVAMFTKLPWSRYDIAGTVAWGNQSY